MAYTLKLNIYNFSLYRITNTIIRPTRDGARTNYETEPDATTFNRVVRTIDTNVNRDSYLPVLFQSVVTYFDSRFKVNDEGTKAVSITTDPTPSYNTLGYVINGMFKGGDTGIGKTVYSQHNAIQPGTRISNTDVPVNNYYYKLWMPYDGEDGILMIQSYTDMGCTATFRDQIEQFFIAKGFRPCWNAMIPSGFIDQYLRRSFIKEIKVLYAPEHRQENGVFSSLSNVRRESRLSNLRIPFSQLFGLENYRQRLQNKIMEFIDYDQQHDIAKVFYVDENGKKASATINNLEEVLPNIILPDNLKNQATDEPILTEISRYTDGILDEIKHQIGYTPNEII
jgi:hypothetical protein